jgi:hypothetical protein
MKIYITHHILQPIAETWVFDVPDDTDIENFKRVGRIRPSALFFAYPNYEFLGDEAGEGEVTHISDVTTTPPTL